MSCFRIPLTLEDADALIVACSGQADWRPLFLLGLATLVIVATATIALVLAARSLR